MCMPRFLAYKKAFEDMWWTQITQKSEYAQNSIKSVLHRPFSFEARLGTGEHAVPPRPAPPRPPKPGCAPNGSNNEYGDAKDVNNTSAEGGHGDDLENVRW